MGANGLGELHVTANRLTGNGGDGISYPQDNTFPSRFGIGPVVFAKNSARHNGGHGINLRDAATGDAAIGVFDGADNTRQVQRPVAPLHRGELRRRPSVASR